jgi:hypothetical protein
VTTNDQAICEVCKEPIEAGEGIVLGQESDGAMLPGIMDSASDGRLAMFHEEHWPMRIGEWQERDRGHATQR